MVRSFRRRRTRRRYAPRKRTTRTRRRTTYKRKTTRRIKGTKPLAYRNPMASVARKIHIPGTQRGPTWNRMFRALGDYHVKQWVKSCDLETIGQSPNFCAYRFDASISGGSFVNATFAQNWSSLSLHNGTLPNQYVNTFNTYRQILLKNSNYTMTFDIPPNFSGYVGYQILRSRNNYVDQSMFYYFNKEMDASQEPTTYDVICRKKTFVQTNAQLGSQRKQMKFSLPWNRLIRARQDKPPQYVNDWIDPYSDKQFTYLVLQMQPTSGSNLDSWTVQVELRVETRFYSHHS